MTVLEQTFGSYGLMRRGEVTFSSLRKLAASSALLATFTSTQNTEPCLGYIFSCIKQKKKNQIHQNMFISVWHLQHTAIVCSNNGPAVSVFLSRTSLTREFFSLNCS